MLFLVLCIVFCAAMLWLFFRIPKTGYYIPLILVGGILTGGAAGNFQSKLFQVDDEKIISLQNKIADFKDKVNSKMC